MTFKIEGMTLVCNGEPAESFNPEYINMLRYVRKVVQNGYNTGDKAVRAIRANAHQIKFAEMGAVRDELNLILGSEHPATGLVLLKKTRLLGQLIPEVDILEYVDQNAAYHPEGDVFRHTCLVVQRAPKHLRWAALLHDTGKAMKTAGHEKKSVEIAGVVLERLGFNETVQRDVKWIIENHMRIKWFMNMRHSKREELMRHSDFEKLVEFMKADDMLNRNDADSIKKYWDEFKNDKNDLPAIPEKRFVDGYDLIAIGLEPSPVFGRLLELTDKAQLEGTINNHSEGMNLVEKELRKTMIL